MDDHDTGGWRRVCSEAGPDYRVFKVRLDDMVSPRTGDEGRYVILECPDWVNVIALTGDEDDQMLLVRQYRHGVGTVTLEIPSGQVDSGEEPLAAAQRELAEETGYTGGRWTPLGGVRPNAAFQDNWCYSFLAEGVRRTETPRLDAGEAIDVETRPLSDIPALIRDGAIDQALVLGAFYALDRLRSRYSVSDKESEPKGDR